MQRNLAPQGVNVVNASISGETTSGGVNRIKADLLRHRPTVVVLALGANDGLRGLAVKEMRRNLETILNEISRAGARPVLVGIQIPPNYGIQYAADFKAVFPKLAAERKLPLVPFLLDGIAENLDNFQADRLHPIAATQPRILQNVMPAVQRAIQSVASNKRSTAKP
jgi:acyl-CoA thioesterase-1